MDRMFYGCKLMLELLNLPEGTVEVNFNVIGHAEHMVDDQTFFEGLGDLDTWSSSSITLDTMQELLEHMEALRDHPIFMSGRTFRLEGYNIYRQHGHYTVYIIWGS